MHNQITNCVEQLLGFAHSGEKASNETPTQGGLTLPSLLPCKADLGGMSVMSRDIRQLSKQAC